MARMENMARMRKDVRDVVNGSLLNGHAALDIVLLFAVSLGAKCIQIKRIEDRDERIRALCALLDALSQLRGTEAGGGRRHLNREKLKELKQAARKRPNAMAQNQHRTLEETKEAIRQILGPDEKLQSY